MNNQNNSDWSKRDVGALWKRDGQNQKYLSGYIKLDNSGQEKELKIVVFLNRNKNNNEKAPDYRIYVSKPLESKTIKQNSETVKSQTTSYKKDVKKSQAVEESLEEDLL